MTDHADCRDSLVKMFAEVNATFDGDPVEVSISTAPPLVRTPYTTDGFRCPHGTTYWIEPTGEQVAKWRKDGVK